MLLECSDASNSVKCAEVFKEVSHRFPFLTPFLLKYYQAPADICCELESGECRRVHSAMEACQQDALDTDIFVMPLALV